ncbi:ATP-binding protein [Achromobacter sp. NPDC058515]|uniref:ATP-binding protein n=1 Tax=Achromobacter sp. NPDC058515 TaxID=3346533 RepID=UPI0036500291
MAAGCAIPACALAAGAINLFADTLASVWVKLTSLVCLGGFLAAVVALLLLRRKARQHSRSEEKLKDLLAFQVGVLDAIPQPIALRDTNLNLVACNSAFQRMLMQPKPAMASTTLEDAVKLLGCDLELSMIEADYRQVMASELPLSKDREFHIGGREMTVQHWMEPLRNARGTVVGVVSGWMDITQRQRVFKELAIARDRAESANRTKTTFLASVSHEIRTPMNAVMGMLELTLARSDLPIDERGQLTTAHHAAKSLLALIDDLLDLSKMEAGKFQLLPKPTNLYELVEEVVGIFRPIAASKGVALILSLDVPDGQSSMHNVDPLRLKQVMNNFVSNAIRFTEHGSVHVCLHADPVVDDRQWIAFTVNDTGVGIPASALATLLQPFVQVEQTLPASDRGTGLGLSICDRLVTKMGGTIQIESELGVGTVMTARLPLPLTQTSKNETRSVAPAASSLPEVAGLHVLVIDDHASNVLLLQRQLQKLGHEVAFAGNGRDALALVDRQVFDLIVCDCAMPVMDGCMFAQTLRERTDAAARLPILGYTAGAHEAEVERARAAGMTEILIKPVDMGTLQRAIATALREHAQGRPH